MISRRVGISLLIVCVVIVALVRLPGDRRRTRAPDAPRTSSAPPDARLLRSPAAVEGAFEEGFYATAETAARDLLKRVEATHGPDAVETAEALDLVVRCLPFGSTAGDPESMELAERAVDLKRRLYGHDDPRVALSLTYKAVVVEVAGAVDEAESLYVHALTLTETTLGPEHPQLVPVIREFAPMLNSGGQFQRALDLAERALRILAVAPDSVHMGHILNAHAWSHFQLGDYVGAISSIDQAIAIRTALFGADHNRVQGIVNNRAGFLYEMGDHVAALEAYQRVLASLRRTLDDPLDARIGTAQLNVGLLDLEVGDLESARKNLQSALQSARGRGSENYTLSAYCLLALGRVSYESGSDDDAETYYTQALDVCETALPAGHELNVPVHKQLAELYYEQKRFDLALQHCERAETILVTTAGREHPYRADIQTVQGRVLAARGEADAAIETSLHAEAISAAHLGLMARGFAEREALLYARRRPHALDVSLRLVARGAKPASVSRVWDAIVRSRALVLEEMQTRSRRAALASDETTVRLVDELRRASRRVANLSVRGPGSDWQRHEAILEAARHERETAEKDLAAHSATFRRDLELERAGLIDVAASLPRATALVAFVVYDRNERRGRAGVAAESRHEAQLLAFVLAPGHDAQVVPIGSLSEVEAFVGSWNREAAYGVLLRSRTAADAEVTYASAATALRELVWDPVEALLGDTRRVLLVPEGALHLVSFAALPGADGKYLVESGWRFLYLTAERDVISPEDARTHNTGLLTIGDVDFDALPSEQQFARERIAMRGESTASAPSATRQASLPCNGLENLQAMALPGTAVEVRQIGEIWSDSGLSRAEPLTVLTGEAATEDAFERLAPEHRVLHIATHAFFLGQDCATAAQTATQTRQLRPSVLPVETGDEPTHVKQPSLAGFFLAGAAHRNEVGLDRNDGVVTAPEIAVMDLQGVELAVLSGCDTGIGDAQVGEGVHGLRRAFHIAGAGSVIMSLWAVSDHAAQEWMTAFYEARFVHELGTVDAVHQATLDRLNVARARGRGTHPFYWGAFVVAGRSASGDSQP